MRWIYALLAGALLASSGFTPFLRAAQPIPPASASASPVRQAAPPAQPAAPLRYVTVPFELPLITTTRTLSGTAPGYIFLSTFNWQATTPYSFLLIVDDAGEPVFYQRSTPSKTTTDFSKQSNGYLTYYDGADRRYHVLDSTYAEVASFTAGNGYSTDPHEFQMLPNGNVVLMSYAPVTMDLTAYGGQANATVIELVIQELNPQQDVVFQWRSSEHIPVADTTVSLLGPGPIDYIHGNAIEVDTDGHLLVSARHTDEIIKINRQTGTVIWRLGGQANQFEFLDASPRFYHQHDIRRLPNGNLLLFDNWNAPTQAASSFSRAMEYQVFEITRTVRLVKEFRNTPDTFSTAMGSAQRFANGNTGVGWGSTRPLYSEFNAAGAKLFELTMAAPLVSYRARRAVWDGDPPWPPTLVAQPDGADIRLYYSWNGATAVADYQVYAGPAPGAMTLRSTQPRTGFETSSTLVGAASQVCYVQVVARDAAAVELGRSALLPVTPSCGGKLFVPMITAGT
jgi:hypothetical protein